MYILQITTLKTILAFHQLIDNPNNHGYSDPIPDHSIAFLMEEERTRQCEGRKKDKTCLTLDRLKKCHLKQNKIYLTANTSYTQIEKCSSTTGTKCVY